MDEIVKDFDCSVEVLAVNLAKLGPFFDRKKNMLVRTVALLERATCRDVFGVARLRFTIDSNRRRPCMGVVFCVCAYLDGFLVVKRLPSSGPYDGGTLPVL